MPDPQSSALHPPGRVAVVGGGITGLATGWFLRQQGLSATLVEAGDRLGGKIQTLDLDGVPVEAGPDTFLARVPWAVDLCKALGLETELVAPATGKAFLWIGDRLHPLPERHVLGVPTALGRLLRSGVLSPAGVARASLDLVLPRTRYGPDPSVADVVGRRMGREVLDRLVDPLVGGIHAGRADCLSLASTARPLADAADRSRSLVLGLRRPAATGPSPGPVFLGLAGGLQRLVDRLAEEVDEARLATRVETIALAGTGWRLACSPGPDVDVEAVVVTVPSFAAAGMLSEVSPIAAEHLGSIRHASVLTATLAYPRSAVAHPLDGAGMLVPRVEGRLLTACTWSTSKWPALAPGDTVLLRASAGRDGDDRVMELDDDEVVRRLHDELDAALGLRERPSASLVSRWPRGFPQYEVGHQARVDAIEAALAADAPGVLVAGAAYRGLGIAACIEQARRAAAMVVAARLVRTS
ncbi:MAG TPA: protoporphyrinogen oxidase [Acidimicrobiales bacterium]|nr:protoporphyrinogen oxidase [Acidimicrobiales bacterium]